MKEADKQRTWCPLRRQVQGGLLSVLCFCCIADFSPAQDESEALPDYPRKSVSELQATALQQLGIDSDPGSGRFVVIGRAQALTGGSLSANYLLVDQLMACCVVYDVGLPMSGGPQVQSNAWIAVYGRLRSSGIRSSESRIAIGGRVIDLGRADVRIEVERVVPAARVVHGDNVLDLMQDERVDGFLELIDLAGLEDSLRAAQNLTLFLPHDVALNGAAVPDPDEEDAGLMTLRHFVLGHIAKGRIAKADLLDKEVLVMMNGDRHPVEWANGKVRVGGARVLMADAAGKNGMVHVIMPTLPVSDPTPPTKSFAARGPATANSYDPLALPLSPHLIRTRDRPSGRAGK